MTILDGKNLANQLVIKIRTEVDQITSGGKRAPHLAAILVGNNPASRAYVGNKMKLCEKAGFRSSLIEKDSTCPESELLDLIHDFNKDPDLDGYIVQLPLPKHIDEQKVLNAISPDKDVDGFHPENIGKMTLGLPGFRPATPLGIMIMLENYGIETAGKHCVVVGRSNIVGTPVSILMSRKGYPGDATVTLAHSKTKNLPEIVRQADIVIAAIGIAEFVKGDWIKSGAVVIDVGMNRVEDSAVPRGYRLTGDVDFEAASSNASSITPVPGGVGPMTVFALIHNTLQAYNSRF
ncbi:MAG: bifunctional 5,10-methylenetetrahydrofolate dehydrogenase/5,10-methenyltetrahydrofolate cyclohydrolase [Saprospiraceae bacterium]|nr:bifunctional 5,10-methylenetetrahydrofolate dehydrogenase/5,10-methenyltetrahydrofolate cyclohydrolase [Saprospiraceae bacterium]